MNRLALVCSLLIVGIANVAYSQTAPQEPKDVERLVHIAEAAKHLEQAGLQGEAKHLKQQLLAELVRLERELDTIRELIGVKRELAGAQQQVKLSTIIFEGKLQTLQRYGFDVNLTGDILSLFVSGRGVDSDSGLKGKIVNFRNLNPTFTLQDTYQLNQLLKELKSKKLIKILGEPEIVTMFGRSASIFLKEESSTIDLQNLRNIDVNWREFSHRNQVTAIPTILENGRLRLEFHHTIVHPHFEKGQLVNEVTKPKVHISLHTSHIDMKFGQTLVTISPNPQENGKALFVVVTPKLVSSTQAP